MVNSIQEEAAAGKDMKVGRAWAVLREPRSWRPCREALATVLPRHNTQVVVGLLKKRLRANNPVKQWLAVHLLQKVWGQARCGVVRPCASHQHQQRWGRMLECCMRWRQLQRRRRSAAAVRGQARSPTCSYARSQVMVDCSNVLGMFTEELLQEVARVMAKPAKPDTQAGAP